MRKEYQHSYYLEHRERLLPRHRKASSESYRRRKLKEIEEAHVSGVKHEVGQLDRICTCGGIFPSHRAALIHATKQMKRIDGRNN